MRRVAERCHGSIRLENTRPPGEHGLIASASFPAVPEIKSQS
ncbi:hypothetical protein [Bradyrhizobium sp. I71]